jgi:hypothetical protein
VNLVDNATRPTYYDGYSRFDRRHAANASIMYAIPELRGAHRVRALVGGWSANFNLRRQSAPPLTVTYGYRDPVDQVTYTYRVDIVPGQPIWLKDGRAPGGRRLNSAAFALPSSALGAGTRNQVNHGNELRNGLRGFSTVQVDLALQKQVRLHGRRTAELRVEAHNVFNHPTFSQPDASIGTVIGSSGQFIPAPLFGRITGSGGFSGGGAFGGGFGSQGGFAAASGARTIQLALRLTF